ncbi:MAG: GDP-L-fucose synthase family protein [Armatimonadota bacterium]
MRKNDKIFIAGHKGLVGSAILRKLVSDGYTNTVLRTHHELDLTIQADVNVFFESERPDYIFLSAAKVGGIKANSTYPADFIRDNLLIQTNVIDAAYKNGAAKLMFLGSSCIYPRMAPQPIKEEYLMTGPLESTNDAYAIAKIAGMKMCNAYKTQYSFNTVSLMPTNLYGPGDNFDLENSHVMPALIRRFYEAKLNKSSEIVIWGTGIPRREFLHVDDLACAAVHVMINYDGVSFLNVGTGEDITIKELAEMIADVVDYRGQIVFDPSKPDGTPRKLLDVSRIKALGWEAQISLKDGIKSAFEWYIENIAK